MSTLPYSDMTMNDSEIKAQNSTKKETADYSHYWLTPEEIEALRQDSIEASRYSTGKFSQFLEEKLGYRKN